MKYERRRPTAARVVQLRIIGGSGAGGSSVAADPNDGDEALATLGPQFDEIYGEEGRPSIPPERLLRALLLQLLYTIRSERMLMEQLSYNLLFRWLVGLAMDEEVWHPTVFTKNRDRLLEGDIATEFLQSTLRQAKRKRLLSMEHFTVDGTLIEAWAGQKSFPATNDNLRKPPPPDPSSNPTLNYRKQKRFHSTRASKTDPAARIRRPRGPRRSSATGATS